MTKDENLPRIIASKPTGCDQSRRLQKGGKGLGKGVLGDRILRMTAAFFSAITLGMTSCSSEAWNNPHGLLGGLFSPPSSQSSAPKPPPSQSTTTGNTQSSFVRLEPPTFSHVVPFPEGDGILLQWRPVENVTDYLVYNGNRLIKDVPTNRTTIMGLLPCRQYLFRIYSSDGTKVSKGGLLVRVHTRGCLQNPRPPVQ
jgi:hypothetical protein